METRCDHTSVGVVIKNEGDELLLIDRARFPFGWAAPAGHVDAHGNRERAAIQEVREETGLIVAYDSLQRVIDTRRMANRCRRDGGDYHDWTIYRTRVEGQTVRRSKDETKGAQWVSRQQLAALALDGQLEPIWEQFLGELGEL